MLYAAIPVRAFVFFHCKTSLLFLASVSIRLRVDVYTYARECGRPHWERRQETEPQ